MRSRGVLLATTGALIAALLYPTAASADSGPNQPANATGAPGPTSPDATAPASSQPLANGDNITPVQQQAVNQAVAQATATGKAVPISALTSETWQISAQPGGGLSLTDNPVPVRTLQAGKWVPVDTTLHKNTDGTFSPAATAYGTVRLSGGGDGPLASTTATGGGANYEITWPTALPTPTISGSTATYNNVLLGVDLEVTATPAGGFSEVLVVHDAKAAANPALAKLTMTAHSTGGHTADALATAANGMSLSMSSAVMWDSNTLASPGTGTATTRAAAGAGAKPPSPAQIAASDPSTPTHAGMAARVAPLQVKSSSSALTLIPNRALLTSKTAVFPEFIDPSVQWHPASGGTPAYDEVKQDSPCNSQSYYKDTAMDDNQLGVGWTNTYCGGYQRTYYQWGLPSAIHGATIHLASVGVTEDWQASFSCTESRTVDLHWSGGIGSGTDWNTKPAYESGANAFTATASVGAAYNSRGCQSPATSKAGFTVTSPVQWSATHDSTQITFGMDQGSNTNYADFDRFTDNPTLDIDFDRPPATPAASQLSASVGASDTAACDTTAPYPYIGKAIASNNVTLTAKKITSPDGDELQATFKYWIAGTSTTHTSLSADNLASGGNAVVTLPTSFTNALTDGQTVSWQVQVANGTTAPSGWSPVCSYTAEPTGPDEPTINANTTYPDNATGAPAGTLATFTVTGNSDGAAATKFYYHLDTAPATSGTPASEIATATNNTATFPITPMSAGPHPLYVEAVDAAGDVSGANTYMIIAAGHATGAPCTSLAACFNNTAISADATPTQADIDGIGSSISATALANAGWTSAGHVTIDGTNLALPAYGSGQKDNVLAANQTIDCTSAMGNCTTNTTGASSLMFLTTATYGGFSEPGGTAEGTTAPYIPDNSSVAGTYAYNGTVNDDPGTPTGTITYSDGSTDSYSLTVPDWRNGPANLAVLSMPYYNSASGKQSAPRYLYAFSVPLTPGKTIATVTLPDLAGATLPNTPAEHIFAIGTRNTTAGTVTAAGTTTATPAGDTWTGAWASDTEGNYTFESSNFSNQSFRVLLQPTVTGNTVRVKLDNALGTSPIDIGAATVAQTNGNAITPTAATNGATTKLTFNGSATTVIPEGGMVYSDPLPYTVTAENWLAVSFQITNSIPYLVQHSWATDSYEYVAPVGSGNHTADTADTEYTASGSVNGTFTDLVTGLDVQTASVPTQIVLGDNLIDAWQPNTAPLSPNNGAALRLSDDIAAASATTPTPYGTINAGIESNQLVKDNPETDNTSGNTLGGQAALTRIDRDLLDEPGLNTLILDEGLEDALAGTDAATIENGYTALLDYLSATGINTLGGTGGTSGTEAFPNIIDVGLTPCDTYNGDGATTGNDPCTTTVDVNRTDVNEWLSNDPNNLSPWSTTPYYYVDPDATIGATDTANGETRLAPLAMVGTSRNNNTPSDPVNLTNAGTGALANAILAATDTWQLDDGDGNTTAADTAPNNSSNAYLTATDPNAGNNFLNLNGTYTWPTSTVHNQTGQTVLQLDGTSAYGATSGPVLNTAGSFSISAWVNLSQIPTDYAGIAAQEGTQASGFYLQYDPDQKSWCLNFMQTDTAGASGAWPIPCATTTPTANTWYHLVGTYNSTTQTAALYVNGTQVSTVGNITTWSANGPLLIGAQQYDATLGAYFPGQISNVQTFNYTLNAPQISALYDQVN